MDEPSGGSSAVPRAVRAGRGRVIAAGIGAARRIRRPVESWIVSSSLVGGGPFLDPADFEWVGEVERRHASIRDELEELLAAGRVLARSHDLFATSRHQENGWQAIVLRYYGLSTGLSARCPDTMRVLDRIPGLRAASFSILHPGATIPPHRGPFAGVVRYHLGVIVPEPAEGCGIRVGSEVRSWTEGSSLMFDESHEHEAWNTTTGLRAVLFLDIERPLRPPARAVNAMALGVFAASPYARSAKKRTRAWEVEAGLVPT